MSSLVEFVNLSLLLEMSGGFCRRVGLNGLTYESGLLNFDWIIKGDSGFN